MNVDVDMGDEDDGPDNWDAWMMFATAAPVFMAHVMGEDRAFSHDEIVAAVSDEADAETLANIAQAIRAAGPWHDGNSSLVIPSVREEDVPRMPKGMKNRFLVVHDLRSPNFSPTEFDTARQRQIIENRTFAPATQADFDVLIARAEVGKDASPTDGLYFTIYPSAPS